MPKKTPRKPRRRKKKHAQLTWLERSLRYRYQWWFWCLAIAGTLIYCALTYTNFVAPLRSRWKGIYGELTLPEGYSTHGIDISHHQGTIDWDKLANSKVLDEPISFVIIKATEGKSHIDPRFEQNFQRAASVGILRGAYHYFKPGISGDQQARHFISNAKLQMGDLPPVLDVEEKGKLSKDELQHEVKECLDRLEKEYQVRPIIYSGIKFKEQYLDSKTFDQYPLWVAHYYHPKLNYKGKWRFWQHTDCGQIEGISGKVDLNIYNGSMYELLQLTIK